MKSPLLESIAKSEDLLKLIMSKTATASMCEPEEDKEESEADESEKNAEMLKYESEWLNTKLQWLQEDLNYIVKIIIEHINKGHIPPIASVEQMKRVIEVLGLEDEYVVKPKEVYAANFTVSHTNRGVVAEIK